MSQKVQPSRLNVFGTSMAAELCHLETLIQDMDLLWVAGDFHQLKVKALN